MIGLPRVYYHKNAVLEREEFIALFLKYQHNECSKEEAERLIRHIQSGQDRQLVEELMDSLPQSDAEDGISRIPGVQESLQRVFTRVQQAKQGKPLQSRNIQKIIGRWASVAAALVITLSVFWYFGNEGDRDDGVVTIEAADIAPGGNRAMLTLADGHAIALSEAQTGIVVGDGQITYQDGAAAVVNLEGGRVDSPAMLTLTTPKGGTYQVTLPDGSKVWLNAASTLSYPSRFDGKVRNVSLSGEGYFEVASNKNKPFRVTSRGQEVEVIGTQFNLSAYPDESETRTTLVEGAVRLSGGGSGVSLLPGQQGVLTDGGIHVKTVDVSAYVGWKSGEFVFDGIELRDAMKQLSRWYDVEVVYEGTIPIMPFYGSFSRNSTLAETLNILKEAKVNFSVQQVGSTNRLVVKP